ncbi:hypothetical protein H4Q26_000064 [Puccinia striiformis f. sp. tritici PST-130]|nr:hypothetical protein H4Q26_000064 [Puccinia striiformis f. sp. tritici PST-130]
MKEKGIHTGALMMMPVYVKMGASRHKPKVNPPDSPVSTRQIGYENDENTKTP